MSKVIKRTFIVGECDIPPTPPEILCPVKANLIEACDSDNTITLTSASTIFNKTVILDENLVINGKITGYNNSNINGKILSGTTNGFELVDFPDVETDNFYTTGATLFNNIISFDRNDMLSAYTLNLSSYDNTDELNSLSGLTTQHTLNINTLSGITSGNSLNIGVLSAITVNHTSNINILSGVTTLTYASLITGGTYSAGTVIFTNNSGGTFSVSGFSTENSTETVNNIGAVTSYTLVLTDDIIQASGTSTTVTVTVPLNSSVAFPIGKKIKLKKTGNFVYDTSFIIQGTGITFNSPNGLIAPGNCSVTLTKVGINTWNVEINRFQYSGGNNNLQGFLDVAGNISAGGFLAPINGGLLSDFYITQFTVAPGYTNWLTNKTIKETTDQSAFYDGLSLTNKTYVDSKVSGTTNHISKFSTSGITDSRIIDNGTYIGIDTVYSPTKDITFGNQSNREIGVEESSNVVIGRDLTLSAGRTIDYITTFNFTKLTQVISGFFSFVGLANGDVLGVIPNFDIYRQTSGVGDFVGIGETFRNWWGICQAPNGDVYATVSGGDIYKQTGGIGSFNPLGQTNRNWRGITAKANGDVLAVVNGGDIYKQTGGVGNFVGIGESSRAWASITTAPNGDIYASVINDSVYKQTGGVGAFISLGLTSNWWQGVVACPNGDVYISWAGGISGDILIQPNGSSTFTSLSQFGGAFPNWGCLGVSNAGNVYSTSYAGGDVWILYNDGGIANLDGGTLKLKSGTGKGSGDTRVEVWTGQKLSGGTDMQIETLRGVFDNEGNFKLPSITNALINADSTGKVVITKEYLNDRVSGFTTGNTYTSELINDGDGVSPYVTYSGLALNNYWVKSGDTIFNVNTGNTGIHTSSPLEPLTIKNIDEDFGDNKVLFGIRRNSNTRSLNITANGNINTDGNIFANSFLTYNGIGSPSGFLTFNVGPDEDYWRSNRRIFYTSPQIYDNDRILVDYGKVISLTSGFTTGYTLTSSAITSTLGYTPLSAYTNTFVTGGTYSNGVATFRNNTGGTFTVSGFFTNADEIIPNLLEVTTAGNVTTNNIILEDKARMTLELDINSNALTPTIIFTNNNEQAGSLQSTNITNPQIWELPNNSGTIALTNDLTGFTTFDTYVTSGVYSAGTAIFTNNASGTFSVTGFTTPFTGGTVNNIVANSLSATTYYNLPLDITTTGGTYSNGVITFTKNNGSTFNVTGLSTGYTLTSSAITSTLGYVPISAQTTNYWTDTGGDIVNNNTGKVRIKIATDKFVDYIEFGGRVFTQAVDLGVTSAIPWDLNASEFVFKNSAVDVLKIGGSTNISYKPFNIQGNNSTEVTVLTAENTALVANQKVALDFKNAGFLTAQVKSKVLSFGIGGSLEGWVLNTGETLVKGWELKEDSKFYTNDIITTSLSAATYYNLPLDIYTTGGTYNNYTGVATFVDNSGNTFNVSGFSNTNTVNSTTSIDFGFPSGLEGGLSLVSVNNSNILSTSQVMIKIIPSSDHDIEDGLLDGVNFNITNIVDGVSFDIIGYANNGTWGIYNLSYKIIN